MLRKIAFISALLFVISTSGTIMSFEDSVIASISQLFGFPALLLWGLVMLSERRIRRLDAFHWFCILFVTWSILSLTWTCYIDFTAGRLRQYVIYLTAIVLFWNMFRNEREMEYALLAYVVGGWITVGGTFYMYMKGDAYFASDNRYGSLGFHPDDLGLIVSLAIPVAWYLGHSSKHLNAFWRFIAFAYPFGAAVAIILSGTRGAVVEVIPAILYLLATMRKLPVRYRVGMAVVGAAVVLMVLRMNDGFQLQRMAGTVRSLSGSSSGDRLNGRLDVWGAGWDVFCKNPWIGIGSGAFPIATLPYGLPQSPDSIGIIAHNTYLSVATELGIVGFLIFTTMLVTLIIYIGKLKRELRAAMYAMLAVWAIGVANLSFEFRWQTWLMFMLIVGFRRAEAVDNAGVDAPALRRTRGIPAVQMPVVDNS